MSKLIENGYTILENMYTQDDIDKILLNKLENIEISSRFDFEFIEKNKINSGINKKISLSEITPFMNTEIQTSQFFWQSDSIIRLKEDFPETSKKILEIYNMKDFRENSNLQTYLPGSFIKKHDDGIVEDRFVVVLTPLNTKPENAEGGDLILDLKDGTRLVIENKIGNVILLDFTENNLKHEVTEIKNWARVVLVSFLFFK